MRFRPIFLTLALVLLIHGTAFADGGNIMGDVYVDGQAASGMCVDVFDNNSNAVASQLTVGDGDYNIYIAQPGSYTVRFSDCGAGYTTTKWYPNGSHQWDAEVVQVVSDQDNPGVNGYLSSAGRITGNVKDTLGAVLTGACVKAEDQDGTPIADTTADGNGNYALGGVPAGARYIRFEGCTAGNYVRSAPMLVTVEAGATTSGVDGVLTPAGRISGHVQNANGDPLPNMCVGGWAGGQGFPNVVTDENGNYVIREVPPSGTYDLSAYDCYGDTYMSAQKSGQLGGVVNQVVSFTLPRPGHIVGHVRDEAGHGLAGICVTANDPAGNNFALAQTDRNGYYELNQIRPGTWDLSFNTADSDGEASPCTVNGDFAPATTKSVVLPDGATVWDVDKTLAHPAPAVLPQGGGDPPAGGGDPAGSAEPQATPPTNDPQHPASATCKVRKLAGLPLKKAKRALAKAGCKVGKVTRKRARRHVRKGTVLRQRASGTRVALTVAK